MPLVILNGREIALEGGVLTHSEVCRLANLSVDIGVSIHFSRGPLERPEGKLGPLDHVKVVHGMRLTVLPVQP